MTDNKKYVFTPPEYRDPGDLVKERVTDANEWAEAFMGRISLGHFGRNDIGKELMHSWFASAIETTKDAMNAEAKNIRSGVPHE